MISQGEFYISSVSVFEVLIGRIEERKVMDFLSAFKVLNVSKKDSMMGSRIYKRLRDKGKNVGSFDVLLSAQAMNRGLTIVTKDTDFLRIREELHDLNLVMITG
ncbi:type II toxin-antitoxin system VapC family toxin [Sulfuracidifex tepidarius]|uniref:type II toxin-antitoxin system VapC family toxin n=1 Tax=Sulfuracidifex tepidarius TaxID=1294262 RepID=UPI00210B74AF|nr:type II toxin-antitoxin system VapC family toxin [Sulfuracidifex tepidarius]